MPHCVHCGGQVSEAARSCPHCGKVPFQVPNQGSKGAKGAIWAVVIGLGCLAVLFFGSIVAAIFIPNFLDALQKAKQKRTMADIRNLGTAVVSFSVDEGGPPPAGSIEELAGLLVPLYIREVPMNDGWGRPLRYECWNGEPGAETCAHFALASAGRDGEWEYASLRDYAPPEPFSANDYDRDIVYGDGFFIRWPQAPDG